MLVLLCIDPISSAQGILHGHLRPRSVDDNHAPGDDNSFINRRVIAVPASTGAPTAVPKWMVRWPIVAEQHLRLSSGCFANASLS